jgi:hypothetical protein
LCRGGDDFVDPARTLFGTLAADVKRQPGDRWKWVSLELETKEWKSGTRSSRTHLSHVELRELRQLAQLGRQPFELIAVDLEHILRSDHDPPL